MRLKFAAVAAVAGSILAAPALAEDLTFDLINQSSANLQELYVSAASEDSWGEDILGTDLLEAGNDAEVTIADGAEVCDYDMRFVMDSGVTVEGTADLCETGSFTLHD